jgi:hypothetical protein
MRILFVPQYPTVNRYQEWWFNKLPTEFRKANFEVKIIGESYAKNIKKICGNDGVFFSPVHNSINFELHQIEEYYTLKLREDDILFLADLSFPGFFVNVLYHKKPKNCFAFCHATSKNNFDYFSKNEYSKFPVESGQALLFKKIFVGSSYHEQKLQWPNTQVTYLPYPPLKGYNKEKIYDIVSASRVTHQKVNSKLEEKVEKKFSKIQRKFHNNWKEYYTFLSQSKILLITSREETFGYQVVDAVLNHCFPLAPSKFSYPELLPPECLYDSEDELLAKIDYLLNSEVVLPIPELLCHKEMTNFYSNIIKTMRLK